MKKLKIELTPKQADILWYELRVALETDIRGRKRKPILAIFKKLCDFLGYDYNRYL